MIFHVMYFVSSTVNKKYNKNINVNESDRFDRLNLFKILNFSPPL